MTKTPPPHQYLAPVDRASGKCPALTHHALEAARLGRSSERGGRIQRRALSLSGQRLEGVPLAGDGGSVSAPPVPLYVAEATPLAAQATRVAVWQIRGSGGVHGPWWCPGTRRASRRHGERRVSSRRHSRSPRRYRHRRRQRHDAQRQGHRFRGRDPRIRSDLVAARSSTLCVGAAGHQRYNLLRRRLRRRAASSPPGIGGGRLATARASTSRTAATRATTSTRPQPPPESTGGVYGPWRRARAPRAPPPPARPRPPGTSRAQLRRASTSCTAATRIRTDPAARKRRR